ncbi:protein of unknown function [Georgfuchsia toluolica]|uniref:Fused signal transduction protein/response regulator n=2 Tax=Georgfuchsia toluolica TaxID=424218 RepID=A0A916J2N2_9PROT|nr:protein of unknown function [Georgfuchsia toluolica]
MSDLLKKIDARTRLAGTNKLEMLLFSLGLDQRTGRCETFGINVFKVREVMHTPTVTTAPEMPESVKGMVSLRGALVPVIDLAEYIGLQPEKPRDVMIVTEYNGHTQGFLVDSVDMILRADWGDMKLPPDMLTSHLGGLVTAVTEMDDKRLVMMLDVERLLSETTKSDEANAHIFSSLKPLGQNGITVLFADDSSVARGQIVKTLDALGVRHVSAINGRKAWDELEKFAQTAQQRGKKVCELLQLVLTDIEMPEVDGYMLTKSIKADPRFAGIPVVMHSSLSNMSNQQVGKSMGIDAYVSKFEPQRLADVLTRVLNAGLSSVNSNINEGIANMVDHDDNKWLIDSPEAGTCPVGSNMKEILLFELGTNETFGINVFKVREVSQAPKITKTPNMAAAVEGLISLRGSILPVLSLGKIMKLHAPGKERDNTLVVAEFSKCTLGFLVGSVDRIIRIGWDKVHAPKSSSSSGTVDYITAITELPDGRLVSILDVEQILADTLGDPMIGHIEALPEGAVNNVFFVDDSAVARKKIVEVLERMGIRHRHATNGLEAWTRLSSLASVSNHSGRNLSEEINLILVDAEMPEMDGYVLTRNIKGDPRFQGIPVVMHSSLSSDANRAMACSVGIDAYVPKFDADHLSGTLRPFLNQ